MQKIIAIATLIISLSVINWSIYKKEALLENGKVVFLKLAPVDPRSLMQGDYMALRFEMANQISADLNENEEVDSSKSVDGLVYVRLDENGIASFVRIAASRKNKDETKEETTVLQFRLREGRVKFATNAYFFEEGSGEKLEAAEYGKFRVNHDGELLLVTLHDKQLKELGR